MKKLNVTYETPNMEVAEMLVEQSVLSGSFGLLEGYGRAGEAGQDSEYLDLGIDL